MESRAPLDDLYCFISLRTLIFPETQALWLKLASYIISHSLNFDLYKQKVKRHISHDDKIVIILNLLSLLSLLNEQLFFVTKCDKRYYKVRQVLQLVR